MYKQLWLGLFIILFIGGYAAVQHLRPTGVSLETSVDEAIPFIPVFVIFYVLYFPLLFALVARGWKTAWEEVMGSLFAILVVSLIIYIVFQTEVSRPVIGEGFFERMVAGVYAADRPVNAFPSLHVAFSVLAFLFFRTWNKKQGIAIGILAIFIILSTLFIKQHTLADVIGGTALAVGAYRFRKKWRF